MFINVNVVKRNKVPGCSIVTAVRVLLEDDNDEVQQVTILRYSVKDDIVSKMIYCISRNER